MSGEIDMSVAQLKQWADDMRSNRIGVAPEDLLRFVVRAVALAASLAERVAALEAAQADRTGD